MSVVSQSARLSGPIGRVVAARRDEVLRVLAEYGVTNVRLFGSVARGEDVESSDVDLLVDLPPRIGLLTLGRVVDDLQEVLGTEVDLVPEADLRPAIRAVLEPELVPL